jgi:hypothetical protein
MNGLPFLGFVGSQAVPTRPSDRDTAYARNIILTLDERHCDEALCDVGRARCEALTNPALTLRLRSPREGYRHSPAVSARVLTLVPSCVIASSGEQFKY